MTARGENCKSQSHDWVHVKGNILSYYVVKYFFKNNEPLLRKMQ